MRVLMIVPYAPTPIRSRPFQLIRTLCAQGHAVTVATLLEAPDEAAALDPLRVAGARLLVVPLSRARRLWNVVRTVPTRRPLQAAWAWSPALARVLAQLLRHERFDVIHVEHLRGAAYGLYVQRLFREWGQAAPPIVWDSVDCISHLFAQAARQAHSWRGRAICRLELPRTRRHEGRLATAFARVLVTAAHDGVQLAALAEAAGAPCPPGQPAVLCNGVDTAYFTPPDGPRAAAAIVCSGKMSYHANAAMALALLQQVMPYVWAERPEVEVWVVGQAPPRALAAWDGRHGGRVRVTGTVPDMRPFLQRATVAAAPLLYGAGVQNKLLEAMACATPVVATPRAVGALAATAGRELLVAPVGEPFARALLHLLADPAQQLALAAAGRRWVEQHHAWPRVGEQLQAIYRSVIHEYA